MEERLENKIGYMFQLYLIPDEERKIIEGFVKSELDLQKKELVEKMMQLKPLYDIEYRDGKALIELEEAIQIINP